MSFYWATSQIILAAYIHGQIVDAELVIHNGCFALDMLLIVLHNTRVYIMRLKDKHHCHCQYMSLYKMQHKRLLTHCHNICFSQSGIRWRDKAVFCAEIFLAFYFVSTHNKQMASNWPNPLCSPSGWKSWIFFCFMQAISFFICTL